LCRWTFANFATPTSAENDLLARGAAGGASGGIAAIGSAAAGSAAGSASWWFVSSSSRWSCDRAVSLSRDRVDLLTRHIISRLAPRLVAQPVDARHLVAPAERDVRARLIERDAVDAVAAPEARALRPRRRVDDVRVLIPVADRERRRVGREGEPPT
jgi:hypothetical protein